MNCKNRILEVFMKVSIAFSNDIGKDNDFMSSLKLFYFREQRGKIYYQK